MPEVADRWAVVVHGGAKTIPDELGARNRFGCLEAAEIAANALRQGRSAVEACELAVRALEDNPVFNAGFGSVLTSDGTVEMDAAIMDGETLAVGGVAVVQRLRNPISAARAMLGERPVLLAGVGAERFAEAQNLALCPPEAMMSCEALASERAHDTVGCVALDVDGHIAAATSTGGLPGKHPGRIGDSPLPGSGLYADDALGGVALSGDGESIIRAALASRVMFALETTSAGTAALAGIERLARVGGEAGAIVIDREGRIGIAHNSDHFAVALHTSDLDAPRAGIHRDELGDALDG